MKKLVIGSTGLLGAHLVRELLKDKNEVKALVRKNSDISNLRGLDVEMVQGDIMDTASLSRAVEGCDVVYHCAAVYSFTEDPKIVYDSIVNGTKNVLETLAKKSLDKIVYTSSVVSLGMTESQNILATEDKPGCTMDNRPYIKAKQDAEFLALKLSEKLDLPLVITCPSAFMGELDLKPTPTGKIFVDFLNGRLALYPPGGINIAYARDIARGQIQAAQKGKIGEKYILSGSNKPWKEWFSMVQSIANTRIIATELNRWFLVGLSMGTSPLGILKGKPMADCFKMALSKKNVYAYYSSEKAEKELGYQITTSPEEMLYRSLKWFLDNGYLKKNIQLSPTHSGD